MPATKCSTLKQPLFLQLPDMFIILSTKTPPKSPDWIDRTPESSRAAVHRASRACRFEVRDGFGQPRSDLRSEEVLSGGDSSGSRIGIEEFW